MKTLTAKKRAVAYELTCANCGDTLPAPNGSLFWTLEEMDNVQKLSVDDRFDSKWYQCQGCDNRVRVPKLRRIF